MVDEGNAGLLTIQSVAGNAVVGERLLAIRNSLAECRAEGFSAFGCRSESYAWQM